MAGEINFGLLQTPDFVGNALQSYDAGQRQATMNKKRNALAMYGTDPDKAISALKEVDPETAFTFEDRRRGDMERKTRKDTLAQYATNPGAAQKTAMESGDPELIDAVSKLSAQDRALKAQQTDEVSAVAYALRNSPYEARKPALEQLGPYLSQRGFTPEQIANFDPTDANLDTVIAQGATLKELLANAREDRTAQSEQRRLDEQARHNREMERIGMTNAGANVTRANKVGTGGSGKKDLSSMSTAELVAIAKGLK